MREDTPLLLDLGFVIQTRLRGIFQLFEAGDGVADVVLEDLDGDGKIDSVSTDVAAETEAKTPADAPVAEAPAADEAPAAAVTTENPDLITTIPVEEASTEEAPEAASETPDENN